MNSEFEKWFEEFRKKYNSRPLAHEAWKAALKWAFNRIQTKNLNEAYRDISKELENLNCPES